MAREMDDEISNYFRSNFTMLQSRITTEDMKRFVSLDNSSERIGFLLSYPEIYKLPLDTVVEMQKNRQKALDFKTTGNQQFSRGQLREALETYSNAVLMAPREDMPVILANRSATLYHLEKYAESLTDIEEAVRIGYPQELLHKIEERRAKCLLALKRHEEAVLAFRNALRALDNAKLPLERRQKLEADIRCMLAVMDKSERLAKKTNTVSQKRDERVKKVDKPITKIRDCNPSYPSCGKVVRIKDDGGDIGRHAVATEDIKPGDVLAIEKPHCAFLLAEYRLTHCHYCLTKIIIPIPSDCTECSCVAYCSVSCRDAEANIHVYECAILPSLWISRTSVNCFLAVRTITQQPFEKLFQLKDKLESFKSGSYVSPKNPHRPEDYTAFYGLVTHEKERTQEDLLHRAYIATWLLRLLKRGPYFPEHVKTPDTVEATPSEGELYIGGLILHNLMVLQFNSHEISELAVPTGDTNMIRAKSKFIGGGLYPTISLFNHSCNPGIIRYFNGTTMTVRAIRSISAGEEISENYGPIFTVTPEAERKRKLRWQYWFDCNCEACAGHWPVLEEIDPTILRFKCATGKECGNVLPVNMSVNNPVIECSKCRNSTVILKGLKTLQDTDTMFKVATNYLEQGNHAKALKSYLKIMMLLDKILALPIRDYHLCQQGVRTCILPFGNVAFV